MQLLSTNRQEAQGVTNLPKVTQLGSGEARTGIQTVRLQSLSLSVRKKVKPGGREESEGVCIGGKGDRYGLLRK